MHPALATANPFHDISVSPGVVRGSLPSGESEPSVTLAFSPGENHIHEIFVGAKRLGRAPYIWRHKPFAALDERAFMDAIEPAPLFLQPGYKFARLGAQ